MRAKMQINVKVATPSEAQRILLEIFEKMKTEGIIDKYHFEIDTPDGVVTEICVLESEKVIA